MTKVNLRLLVRSVLTLAAATYLTVAALIAALILPASGFADFNFLLILVGLTGSAVLFFHLCLTLPIFLLGRGRFRLFFSSFIAAISGAAGVYISNWILENTLIDDHDDSLTKNLIVIGIGIAIGMFSACLAWLIRRADKDMKKSTGSLSS